MGMILVQAATPISIGKFYSQTHGEIFKVTHIETYKGLSEVSLLSNNGRIMKVLSVHWYESELTEVPEWMGF